MTARGAADFLTRSTSVLGGVFIVLSILTIAVGFVGPALLACASPELRAQYLPKLYRGDLVMCQLFSEPNAGSDLASARTRVPASVLDKSLTALVPAAPAPVNSKANPAVPLEAAPKSSTPVPTTLAPTMPAPKTPPPKP